VTHSLPGVQVSALPASLDELPGRNSSILLDILQGTKSRRIIYITGSMSYLHVSFN